MYDHMERRRADIARHNENRGRLAHVYARYTTRGQGTVQFDQRINFGLTYVEEPYMQYGSLIDPDAVQDVLNLGPRDDLAFPQCTGYVCEWDKDDHGHYVGAWVGVAVAFPITIVADAQIEVSHHFSFEATAVKSFGVPDDD